MALKSETASPPNGMVNVINQERCSSFFVQNSLGDEHFIFPKYIYFYVHLAQMMNVFNVLKCNKPSSFGYFTTYVLCLFDFVFYFRRKWFKG